MYAHEGPADDVWSCEKIGSINDRVPPLHLEDTTNAVNATI